MLQTLPDMEQLYKMEEFVVVVLVWWYKEFDKILFDKIQFDEIPQKHIFFYYSRTTVVLHLLYSY